MLVHWVQGAEITPGSTEMIFSLEERAEVMKEEPQKLLGMEIPSLSISPSWGRCHSCCPVSIRIWGAAIWSVVLGAISLPPLPN